MEYKIKPKAKQEIISCIEIAMDCIKNDQLFGCETWIDDSLKAIHKEIERIKTDKKD